MQVGELLKSAREARGMSQQEVARATRIPLESIARMEEDAWDALPGEVFARGFARAYAKLVGADEVAVLEGIPLTPEAERGVLPHGTGLGAGNADGREANNYGTAVAFVVLLILFSVAASMVMRPRSRNVPPQLSAIDAPASSAV